MLLHVGFMVHSLYESKKNSPVILYVSQYPSHNCGSKSITKPFFFFFPKTQKKMNDLSSSIIYYMSYLASNLKNLDSKYNNKNILMSAWSSLCTNLSLHVYFLYRGKCDHDEQAWLHGTEEHLPLLTCISISRCIIIHGRHGHTTMLFHC